jgi:molecular chaperone GrpE
MNQNKDERGSEHDEEPVPVEQSAHDVHLDDSAHSRMEVQLRRAMADLANLRKRQARDLADARQRAIEGLIVELLPVLDNFHLALGATEARPEQEESGSIVEGLKMVRSMLMGVLERYGVSEITAAGEVFDPNLHEAVGLDHESDSEPGRITSVVLRGYRMNDKVLRPTRVIVKGEAPEDDTIDARQER